MSNNPTDPNWRGFDTEFLRTAWSAETPKICPHCKEELYETSMHPCFNGDWTCRCMNCMGLIYRVTRERIIYWPELEKRGED